MAVRPDCEGITEMNARPNIVLVHGAWADGSSWTGVIERLQAGGFHVTAPQFPLTALAGRVGENYAAGSQLRFRPLRARPGA